MHSVRHCKFRLLQVRVDGVGFARYCRKGRFYLARFLQDLYLTVTCVHMDGINGVELAGFAWCSPHGYFVNVHVVCSSGVMHLKSPCVRQLVERI